MIPIEIVNKILSYSNDVVIIQYDLKKNEEYYIINFKSDLLWKIKANLVMKRIYPLYGLDNFVNDNKILYKIGSGHYENLLRNNKMF
jgi:hypothetical protein